ncbi:AMP-binding protein [Planosporangium mesophilum]|uniref:Long-chain acyl-CoA synthetase n=1 Tax=Planosporangium mesophilum TaxID=689768 RepID=A0A8J3WYJ2_9ACTN|nr:AMP-binding protein [Planosporangium mesophilum]GII21335.1 long-chain acyl-CoA synthetase [Planosporangium mesophilum]
MQDVRNVADLVRRAASSGADRPALRWHDRVITWGELDMQVDAVAAALRSVTDQADDSVQADDDNAVAARIAIALPNVPEFATAYFGALRAGLVVVPVNPGYTARELRHLLADTGAEVIIGTPAVLAAVATVEAPALRHAYAVGESAAGARPFAELLAAAPTPVEPTAGGEDIAVLLYTSGTSGMPKGAMLSHRALLANHAQLAAIEPQPMGADDVVLLTLPLFHSYGLNTGLGAIAYHGACGVLVERFDPADTLTRIRRQGVTVVVGVPPMYVAWSLMGDQLATAFAGVRIAVSGAAPLDVETARRFAEVVGRPVYEGYGLTETAPVLTTTMGEKEPKVGSIGRPLPDVDVQLVDADGQVVGTVDDEGVDDDDLEYDSPGSPGTDPGVMVVRGPNLFSGYWPDGSGGPDANGWWFTADVAYADADGDLFLVDRVGDLIIVSGFNVYPHEVELVLSSHPAVVESAVVGVEHPYTQQTVKAYVVRRPGVTVTAEDLIAYCEGNLARFKCPTAVEFVAELPKSATGKVRRGELGG